MPLGRGPAHRGGGPGQGRLGHALCWFRRKAVEQARIARYSAGMSKTTLSAPPAVAGAAIEGVEATAGPAKISRRFPFRYLRVALAISMLYGAVFLGMFTLQGRLHIEKLPLLALISLMFGTGLTAYFAYLEARAMKQLGIAYENGEGVPKLVQKREISLSMSHEEAAARVETALFVPGIVIDQRDPSAGVFTANTGQTWKGYGEKLKVTLSGQYPVRVTIESRPRVSLFGLKIDYGKNWENVEGMQARLLADPAQKSVLENAGATSLGCLTPPRYFMAGALHRLLPVLFFYGLGVFFMLKRAGAMPDSAPQLPALMLITLPLAGAVLELWAFMKFRLAAKAGQRGLEQEAIEGILNNSFPVLFALGMLMRPEQPLWSGENLVAMLFASLFGYLVINQAIERSRARTQRLAISGEREKAELQRQLAEAKLAALSAQIEPHFLFNTLASIQYLTRHDADKAHAMVSDLIRYLRLVLPRMKQTTARLADELQLVQAYLSIMHIRMGERLRFRVDDAGVLAEKQIPTMVLITLVENAIKHGLERKSDGGEVRVSVSADAGNLLLEVADTGGGFSTASSGTGIGLANVRERLGTLYGQRGILALAANEPSGVKATVTIPLERH